MRRIKTFALFESQDQYELGKIHGDLDKATDCLGLDWKLDWNNGLATDGKALATGEIKRVNQISKLAKSHECKFRYLILEILFGVPPDHGHGCKLEFFDSKRKEILNPLVVQYHSDAANPGDSGDSNYYISVSREWNQEETISHILDEIKRIIGSVTRVKCKMALTNEVKETSGLESIVPSLLRAFASNALGEGEWINMLCGIIREAGAFRNKLIERLREMSPDIWEKIKPSLGAGAEESGDLGDLGF